MSNVGGEAGSESGSRANSAISCRSGLPVTIVFVRDDNPRKDSSQGKQKTSENRLSQRVALPGTTFCSKSTIGTHARRAARTGGTLAKPPRPTRTLGRSRDKSVRACRYARQLPSSDEPMRVGANDGET